MPVKLKGKVYKTVIRPDMLYGVETWATMKRQEKRIEVTEMRMLRWTCGVTRKDKIRNEHIRGTTRVAQASKKITERRLNWYGHVITQLQKQPTEYQIALFLHTIGDAALQITTASPSTQIQGPLPISWRNSTVIAIGEIS